MANKDTVWVSPADEYVTTLKEETLEMARVELREDPSLRKQALVSLREWVYQNPRIKNCRLGMITLQI